MAWVSENIPNWEQDPRCEKWLSRVGKSTAKSIRYSFPVFLGFVEKTPSQIYRERIEDMKAEDPNQQARFEDLLIDFKNALAENHYTENSVKAMVGRVQSFFAHNRIDLKFRKGWLRIDETDFAKTQHVKRLRLSNAQLRRMYSFAETIESRVSFLLMLQNGFGPSELSKFQIDMLPVTEDTEEQDAETGALNFIYFETDRAKTGIDVSTFLSGEAAHDLKIHLEKRGWPRTGYLFETRTGGPVRADHISQWVKDLGAALGEDLAEHFDPYDLRHYFHESLENARVPNYHLRALMGHQKRGAEGSYLGGIEGLLESYRSVFPRLSVNGVTQSRSDIKELRANLETFKGDYEDKLAKKDKDIEKLNNQIDTLMDVLSKMPGFEDYFKEEFEKSRAELAKIVK